MYRSMSTNNFITFLHRLTCLPLFFYTPSTSRNRTREKQVVYTDFSLLEMGSNRAAVLVTILIPWKTLFINTWLIRKYSSIFRLLSETHRLSLSLSILFFFELANQTPSCVILSPRQKNSSPTRWLTRWLTQWFMT